MRHAIFAAALLCLPTLAWAQDTADSVKKDQPFSAVADHDGLDTEGYALYINGQLVSAQTIAALVNGSIKFPFPQGIASKGTYVIYIEAYNQDGRTNSSTITLTVTLGNPSAPKNPRIEKQ